MHIIFRHDLMNYTQLFIVSMRERVKRSQPAVQNLFIRNLTFPLNPQDIVNLYKKIIPSIIFKVNMRKVKKRQKFIL